MLGYRKYVVITLEEGSQLDRTMNLLRIMDTDEYVPEAVKAVFRLLGDRFPDGNCQEMKIPTDKQLRYICHLANLTRNEGDWFITYAREQEMDMSQAGHIIMKLREGS